MRSKLINFYKEKKFNQHGGDAPKKKLPSMLIKEIVEKHCASFLVTGMDGAYSGWIISRWIIFALVINLVADVKIV